jgi:transposase
VLAAIRALNRFQLVGETMSNALNALAVAAPDWLRAHAAPEWTERYERRFEDTRLPADKQKRQTLAETFGRDGALLLQTIYASGAPDWLRHVPAVETLRQVWVQNYCQADQSLQWREGENIPRAALFISSPLDGDAHLAK